MSVSIKEISIAIETLTKPRFKTEIELKEAFKVVYANQIKLDPILACIEKNRYRREARKKALKEVFTRYIRGRDYPHFDFRKDK